LGITTYFGNIKGYTITPEIAVIIGKVIGNKYSLTPTVNILTNTTRMEEIPKESPEYVCTNLLNVKMLVL